MSKPQVPGGGRDRDTDERARQRRTGVGATQRATTTTATESSRGLGERNDRNVLLLVATLITTLTYQLGTNLPSGYYQEDGAGYQAGDSILRHKHHRRYWLFMTGGWTGFGSSMLMTLALLTGAPTGSRLIRWPFAVSYSSLVLTFISSQPKTKLSLDIVLWILVLFILWAAISFKQRGMSIPEALGALKGFVRRRFCR